MAICSALATSSSASQDASSTPWLEHDAVDDGFDGVVLALLERDGLGEVAHLAVDAGAEALLVEGFEQFLELALAAADDGRDRR